MFDLPAAGELVKEGYLLAKTAVADGKKASDRSWKPYWILLRGHCLYLFKDKAAANTVYVLYFYQKSSEILHVNIKQTKRFADGFIFLINVLSESHNCRRAAGLDKVVQSGYSLRLHEKEACVQTNHIQ